ncbi:MAG: hypothetical protein WAW39_13970 [Prosthecobacter sp.]|uniref:hypothetical protein n=1 Tax=Prosthecobacter sp. TaxID=1965333 RepID=UPI003BAF44A4
MPGIYIAALLTSLVAIAGFGALIYKLPKPANGWLLLGAIMICLPLKPLAFYWVRLPLDHWIAGHLARTSFAYQFMASLYAPLTEESAKLLVLLIPAILRDIRPENFTRYALGIGLAFALGEMWFIAERISHQPALAKLPFYQFGGYVSERLMTCVFHSAFVAITLSRLRRGWLLGLGGAMAAHWAANFPISLMTWNVGGLGRAIWEVIVAGGSFDRSIDLACLPHLWKGSAPALDVRHPALSGVRLRLRAFHGLWTKMSAAKQIAPLDPPG